MPEQLSMQSLPVSPLRSSLWDLAITQNWSQSTLSWICFNNNFMVLTIFVKVVLDQGIPEWQSTIPWNLLAISYNLKLLWKWSERIQNPTKNFMPEKYILGWSHLPNTSPRTTKHIVEYCMLFSFSLAEQVRPKVYFVQITEHQKVPWCVAQN